MQVETPSSAGRPRTAATYATVVCGFALLFLAPSVAVPAVGDALSAVGTALLAGIAARALWSTALAVRTPTPPPPAEWPSVSVVVTAYNEADTLPETVAACRELEYPGSLEVLLCYESASTDGTARIAEEAARAHDCITAVRRDAPPGGKAAAVNYALDRTAGEVVASIDANQRPDPAMLRRGVRWFRDDDVRCVKGRCYGINATDSLIALHATVERHLLERAEFYARDVFGGFTLFTGGQVLFRADLTDDLGPFDESVLIEDVDMACRVHRAGGDVRVDPGVVTYEDNPASLSAWLSQRKRWARGAFQVARRHALSMLRSPRVPLVTKLDAGFTFGYVLIAPLLVLAFPALWVAAPPLRDAPVAAALRFSPAAAGLVAAAVVFALDSAADRSHARREYLAPFTLWAYAALQSTVVVTAFLDEFVLDAPVTYVTSSTEDASAGSDD